MIEKPKIGEPCNYCGLCCQIQVCKNGAYVQKLVSSLGETVPGPCPALVEKHDGTYRCGIVENPNKYIKGSKYPAKVLSKHFANLIGAGAGCDEIGYDEDPEEEIKLDNMVEVLAQDENWIKKTKQSLKIIHGI